MFVINLAFKNMFNILNKMKKTSIYFLTSLLFIYCNSEEEKNSLPFLIIWFGVTNLIMRVKLINRYGTSNSSY